MWGMPAMRATTPNPQDQPPRRSVGPDGVDGDADGSVGYFPLPLTLAALISFFSLYLTARRGQGLIILGLLLLASYHVRWRIPHERIVRWTARIVPMCAIALLVGWPNEDIILWYIKPAYTNLIGYLLATEIVIQSYLRRPKEPVVMTEALRDPVRLRESYGFVLLLTGGIMITAANTYDRSNMQLLVPAYMLAVVMALRSFVRLSQPSPQESQPDADRTGRQASVRRVRLPLATLRGFAVLIAMALGFAAVFGINEYERGITNWAMKLFSQDRYRRSEIGLSGTARLRASFNPAASLNRVLLIEGTQSEGHLRALAYDTYADRLWHPVLRQREYRPIELPEIMTAREGRRMVFRRIGDTLDLLPMPLEALSIEPNGPVETDPHGVMRTADRGANLRYEIVAGTHAQTHLNPLMTPPEGELRERLLALPEELDPAVVELSRQIAGNGDPMQRIMRLQLHLRSNHEYSLRFEPEGEPLSDFILNQRPGHCQFFASALTVMARAVGVPARMVSGFYAHERYGDDAMVVRDRDAHAWAEVFIDGIGWVTVDATPAGGRPDQLFEEPSTWRRAWERVSDIPRAVQEWLSELGREAVLWFVLAISLLALTIWFIQRIFGARRRAQRRAQEAYAVASSDLAEIAGRFNQLLQQRGVPCEENRTWREHLAMLTQRPAPVPIDVSTGRRFVDAYDEARFGGENGQALQRVSELLQALESQQQ